MPRHDRNLNRETLTVIVASQIKTRRHNNFSLVHLSLSIQSSQYSKTRKTTRPSRSWIQSNVKSSDTRTHKLAITRRRQVRCTNHNKAVSNSWSRIPNSSNNIITKNRWSSKTIIQRLLIRLSRWQKKLQIPDNRWSYPQFTSRSSNQSMKERKVTQGRDIRRQMNRLIRKLWCRGQKKTNVWSSISNWIH